MEGRRVVLQAPYWIGVYRVIVTYRQIRTANESAVENWRFVKENLQEHASKKNF